MRVSVRLLEMGREVLAREDGSSRLWSRVGAYLSRQGLEALGKACHANEYGFCPSNEGFEAALEIRKIYRCLPDDRAETEGLIRVVDESGEND